jgi:hypothetical protein
MIGAVFGSAFAMLLGVYLPGKITIIYNVNF